MKDPKGARRKYLGYIEMQRMIARYPIECKELVYRKETEEEKEDARADSAPEGLSGHDRARGGEVQHRPLHPRRPVSHGDGAEKLPAHDG